MRENLDKRQSSWVETLESRQLLSAVIDLRLADGGGKALTLTSVGQKVSMNVYAVITGADASTANEGVQDVAGSFLGAKVNSAGPVGDLAATVFPPFTSSGSQSGTPTDLNGDGGLDVGNNSSTSVTGLFVARAGGMVMTGTVEGSSKAFLIGSVTYTVKTLTAGETDINFRAFPNAYAGVWMEDGVGHGTIYANDHLTAGTPIKLTVAGPPVTTGTIAGEVFNDANGDGTLGGSEVGLANVRVYVDSIANGVFDAGERSGLTDASGNYKFYNFDPGTYRIRQVVPTGYRATLPSAGYYDVAVTAGADATGKNFGDTTLPPPPTTGTVAGKVFYDGNADGIQGSGEAGLANVRVYVDANKNGVFDSSERSGLTDASGNYKFYNFTAGTYRIREVLPSGYRIAAPSAGYYDVAVTAGANITAKNFADTRKILIEGWVYNDANGNKTRDAGEGGLQGFNVYIDLNNNGVWNSNEYIVGTDASGKFGFGFLNPGTYVVRVVAKTGYKATTGTGFSITLGYGGIVSKNLFGEKKI